VRAAYFMTNRPRYRTAYSSVFAISTACSATAQARQVAARAHLVVGRQPLPRRIMEGLPVIREESAVVGSVLILQATQSTPTFAHILLCLLDMKRNNVVDHHTLLGH